MHDLTERNILRTARTLASFDPPSDVADAALFAARLKFVTHANRRSSGWRWAWVGRAAAAMILLAGGIFLLLWHSSSPAAVLLQKALIATAAFKGTVHIVGANRSENAPAGITVTIDLDTVNGTISIVDPKDQGGRIRFYSKAQGTWQTYDGNTIFISDAGDEKAVWSDYGAPVTWEDFRQRLELQPKDSKTHIKESREGLMDRFDVTMNGPQTGSAPPAQDTVSFWIDDGTRLIQKISAGNPKGRMTASYQYGTAAVADIYAAGAPKDAKIVDRRAAKDVASLIARMREAAQKDFGDYIAIVANCDVNNGIVRRSGYQKLEVFAKRGPVAIKRLYWVTDHVKPKMPPFMRAIPTPAGWPTPDIHAALKSLANIQPARGMTLDGTKLTGFILVNPDGPWGYQTHDFKSTVEQAQQSCLLPAYLFRDCLDSTIPNSATSFELLPADKEHAGLQGLRTLIDQPGSREQAESVIWVDPSKGFVPVSTRFGAAGKEPASHTEFTDFADLGSGRFYSRTWRQTWTPIPSGPQTTEYHLQILPEAPATHWMEHPVYVP